MFHVSVFLFIIKWARIHLVARTGERRWKFKSLVPKFSISHCKANCLVELIRPPGTVVSPRRSFVLLLMFFLYFFSFFSPRDLRHETLPRDRKYVQFYNPGPKIRWPSTKNKSADQNVQNSGRLQTTLDYDREYLREG